MEGARSLAPGESARRKAVRLTPEQAMQQIHKLEAEMFRLARNLGFEKAGDGARRDRRYPAWGAWGRGGPACRLANAGRKSEHVACKG